MPRLMPKMGLKTYNILKINIVPYASAYALFGISFN